MLRRIWRGPGVGGGGQHLPGGVERCRTQGGAIVGEVEWCRVRGVEPYHHGRPTGRGGARGPVLAPTVTGADGVTGGIATGGVEEFEIDTLDCEAARPPLDSVEVAARSGDRVRGACRDIGASHAMRCVCITHGGVGKPSMDVRPEVGLPGAAGLGRIAVVAKQARRTPQFQRWYVLGHRRALDGHGVEPNGAEEESRHHVLDRYLELVLLAGHCTGGDHHIGVGVVVSILQCRCEGSAVGRAGVGG